MLPPVDRTDVHTEEISQLLVGRTQPAKLERLFGEFRLVAGRTPGTFWLWRRLSLLRLLRTVHDVSTRRDGKEGQSGAVVPWLSGLLSPLKKRGGAVG